MFAFQIFSSTVFRLKYPLQPPRKRISNRNYSQSLRIYARVTLYTFTERLNVTRAKDIRWKNFLPSFPTFPFFFSRMHLKYNHSVKMQLKFRINHEGERKRSKRKKKPFFFVFFFSLFKCKKFKIFFQKKS